MAASKKKQWKLLLRVAVSGALLAFIFAKVDLEKLGHSFGALSLETVLLLCSLYLFGQLLSALKWRILTRSVGINRPLLSSIRAYVFGMFVNSFGFGTVGGDVARAVALRPAKGERAAAFATVLADRVHGLGVLLALGAISILTVRPAQFPGWALLLSAGAALGIGLFWWIAPKLLLAYFKSGHRFNQTAVQAANAFPHAPETFLPATALSVAFHSSQIFMLFVITQELSLPLPLSYLFCVVPIVNTISTLPFSIQGLGVRESLFTLFFAAYGVGQEQAVACGAVWFLIVTVVSALCGVIFTPDLVRSGDKILEEREPAEIIPFESKKQKKG